MSVDAASEIDFKTKHIFIRFEMLENSKQAFPAVHRKLSHKP